MLTTEILGIRMDGVKRHPGELDEALQHRLVEAWVSCQRTPNTRAAYRNELKTFAAWCASRGSIILHADLETMVAFAAAREAAGDSPSTLRRRWSALSSFFEFAVDHDAAPTNPLVGVRRPAAASGNPSSTVQLSARQIAEYRDLAAALDPRLEALVALLVTDGLKLGEALALDIDDVRGRPPRTTLTIRRRGAETRVPLDPGSAKAVFRCIGSRRDGPIFLSGGTSLGRPRRLTRFGADHLVRQLSRGGSQRVTTNELRRFHITSGVRGAGDLASVRDRAGLASVRSVQRYLVEPTETTSQATTMS
jgi:site-specific recombinase XerD